MFSCSVQNRARLLVNRSRSENRTFSDGLACWWPVLGARFADRSGVQCLILLNAWRSSLLNPAVSVCLSGILCCVRMFFFVIYTMLSVRSWLSILFEAYIVTSRKLWHLAITERVDYLDWLMHEPLWNHFTAWHRLRLLRRPSNQSCWELWIGLPLPIINNNLLLSTTTLFIWKILKLEHEGELSRTFEYD